MDEELRKPIGCLLWMAVTVAVMASFWAVSWMATNWPKP